MSRPFEFSDSDEPWTLPVAGFKVFGVEFNGPLLYIKAQKEDQPRLVLQLSGKFVLCTPDGRRQDLDVEAAWGSLVPVLDLRDAEVASVTVDRHCELTLQFTGGMTLLAGPSDDFENWELRGPGFWVVATAGDRPPSIWAS